MNVLIVNPNPVFDRTTVIQELVPGAVMRTVHVELTAGGKGINVARVLRALGIPAPLLIPVGRDDAARYAELLTSEDADAQFVEVDGPVRHANIYLERNSERVTVINDAGHPMSREDWSDVHQAILENVKPGDLVLVMGSFPPKLDVSTLPQLIHALHESSVHVLLDVNPQWLTSALAVAPDIVTPNLDEAEAALTNSSAEVMASHNDDATDVRVRAENAARELCRKGAKRAFVTAGAVGVAMASEDETTWVSAIPVRAVSTVGAGDSFVAGLVASLTEDADLASSNWARATAFGVAAAAASCEQVRAGGVDPQRIQELLRPLLVGGRQ